MFDALADLGPSVWIFVAFAALILALLVAVGFFFYDRVGPVVASAIRNSAWLAELSTRIRNHRKAKRRLQQDDDTDDLDDAAQSLLSMLSLASVVVDDHDDVVRANPEAYALGIVADELIIEPRVIDAVHAVLKDGGRRSFDLTTDTPERFMHERGFLIEHGEHDELAVDTVSAGESADADAAYAQALTRPNWLKVTVGAINEHLAVVLIDDVSDAIRFSRIRDSFITNVSEQLLQPTQALERLADSMESSEISRERIVHDAAQVRRDCTKLEHMVSDLLLLIRAQEPVTPSAANRINLMEQVQQAGEQWQPIAHKAGMTLRIGGDDTVAVHGDAEQIRTAVGKLIDNAIGYSTPGSSIGVAVAKSSNGQRAIIRVIDRGCGIAKAEAPRIFERFYRGSNQNERTSDGIGLGLAIVKHVALAHHGSVTLWSAPKQGSTFTLSLPLAQD
ncbi:sensor histidine kinase [Bifidobacterium goeldii]|nr:ATP-binding protein [Bifidobacterium goeldii]